MKLVATLAYHFEILKPVIRRISVLVMDAQSLLGTATSTLFRQAGYKEAAIVRNASPATPLWIATAGDALSGTAFCAYSPIVAQERAVYRNANRSQVPERSKKCSATGGTCELENGLFVVRYVTLRERSAATSRSAHLMTLGIL